MKHLRFQYYTKNISQKETFNALSLSLSLLSSVVRRQEHLRLVSEFATTLFGPERVESAPAATRGFPAHSFFYLSFSLFPHPHAPCRSPSRSPFFCPSSHPAYMFSLLLLCSRSSLSLALSLTHTHILSQISLPARTLPSRWVRARSFVRRRTWASSAPWERSKLQLCLRLSLRRDTRGGVGICPEFEKFCLNFEEMRITAAQMFFLVFINLIIITAAIIITTTNNKQQ